MADSSPEYATYVGIVFGTKLAPKISPQVVVLIGLSIFAIANHFLTLQLTPDTPALNLYPIVVLHDASLGDADTSGVRHVAR